MTIKLVVGGIFTVLYVFPVAIQAIVVTASIGLLLRLVANYGLPSRMEGELASHDKSRFGVFDLSTVFLVVGVIALITTHVLKILQLRSGN